MNIERIRLQQHYNKQTNWLKWGPYLAERQWGTVREDYSADGNAWNYLSHDMARSKAYRWGEEGIAGISDENQTLCLSLALWNGRDPILKERFFGLTNEEGNHGEDVKELYYYLDNTPTHSYFKMLYKYPQQTYPYQQLIEENRKRSRFEPEFELLDTGIFDSDQYFDVFAEFAKQDEEDILISYTICNRGEQEAPLHVIPQVWFRNNWSVVQDLEKPRISQIAAQTLLLQSTLLGDYYLYMDGECKLLFTENETNNQRLYHSPNVCNHVKDGINDYVVHGQTSAINPYPEGTKVGICYKIRLPALSEVKIKLRLSKKQLDNPFSSFENILGQRKEEADLFYQDLQQQLTNDDERLVQRQAWAGLLWSKQYYHYNVKRWLDGDQGIIPPPEGHRKGRNSRWKHLMSEDILAMPDTWEYPWFAAWDMAFHCIAFAPIDSNFAKKQLRLLISDNYIHPNGQLPAYEWDFSDVNPPVHALAAWQVFETEKQQESQGDIVFLEEIFQKLLLNFTWWVNRKDSEGNNIFEGGFLGLDNIGPFNRNAPVPGGGRLEQADGTSWMAMYALNMMHIAMELSLGNHIYEEMAIKFAEHFFYIAGSIANMGEDSIGLWDDEDGFYYDLLRKPDGTHQRLRLRTLVGLIPMFAVSIMDDEKWEKLPRLKSRLNLFMRQRPDLIALVSRWKDTMGDEKHLFSLLRGHRMKLLLRRMLNPEEFLSPYGIRSLSKVYEKSPFQLWLDHTDYGVHYVPGESDSAMFGGNSNWRGPIWMPINYLLIQSLKSFHEYYTSDFRVEYPTGSGNYLSLAEIAEALGKRLKNIFLRDEKGERAVFGGHPKLNHDVHFKDYILFYEYFHGNTGKGLGASHQTGWTSLIALL